MINQAILIMGLADHFLYPMQCQLNGVQLIEIPKFLAGGPCETTHAIQLVNLLNATNPLVIQYSYSELQVSLMCIPQTLQNMKMTKSPRFI